MALDGPVNPLRIIGASEPAILEDGDHPIRRSRRAGMRRVGLLGLCLVILGGAAWTSVYWWTVGRYIETTDDAYVGGNVTAIAPHVSGLVTEVLVLDNQWVHAGQALVRLDRRDFQAAVDRAAAAVHARRADVVGLRAQYVLQQATIRDREAQSAVTSSVAALEAARQQLQVLEAQISAAQAAEAEARSELRAAELNLGYTEIRSPIDGYVTNRAAQVGAYVVPGAYLLSLVPARGLWVDANFKEDQLARIRPGQSASLVADLLPHQPFLGRVLSLAHGTGAVFSVIPPENATGNFTKIVQRVPVRITLDPRDVRVEILRPGLSITASVDTRTHPPRP